jgi:YidC/Oxa1 family membrane protein insertase
VFAELLDYPLDQENPEKGNVILFDREPSRFEIAQTGWLSTATAPGADAPHTFETSASTLTLADGATSIELPLVWRDAASGLTVRKVYTFTRGSYAIGVRHELVNEGTAAFTGNLYQQLLRVPPPPPAKTAMFTNPESFSFVGAAWYSSADHFEKRKFDAFVEDGTLECWAHGSKFELTTGKPLTLPAYEPVPVFTVSVRDGNVYIDPTTPKVL